jgi:hypothetical protein
MSKAERCRKQAGGEADLSQPALLIKREVREYPQIYNSLKPAHTPYNCDHKTDPLLLKLKQRLLGSTESLQGPMN